MSREAHALSGDACRHVKRRWWLMRPICGGQWLICHGPSDVAVMLEEADDGASYIVKSVLMSEAEVESTKEFDGW